MPVSTCGQRPPCWAAELWVLKQDITREMEKADDWVLLPRVDFILGAVKGLGSVKPPGGAEGKGPALGGPAVGLGSAEMNGAGGRHVPDSAADTALYCAGD